MKKQKAFTLIELLAVIVILAVIALIASPIIMGVIGKTKRQAFERSIDGILDAVRIDYSSDGFVSPREYFYEGNNLILLTVNEETLDESVGIKGKINGKGFIYVDEDGNIHIENICSKDYCANGTEPNVEITENATGEIPELSKNDPMIKIKGEKTVYVNIGDTYTELGATAKTKSGQVLEYTTEITLNGTIVTSIDTTNENTYVITYKTEHEGKTVTDTRNVVILDMKPVISITEGKETYVKEQEILITTSAVRPNTITSVTVEIKKDGENIKTETVTGISKTITLNETGNYEVIVTVTDNHEHTSTITKAYKIDSEPPEIEFTSEITLKANEVSGFVFSEDDTVVVSDNSNLVTWKTEGNLNSIKGDQEITYIATDEAGNETRKIRTFHIDEAKEPSINFSSPGSNGIWIKAITVTLYARIEIDNDELTAFTYQVDDGEIVNVPITNNQQMDVDVTLNTTGRHTIKVTATGKHGNTKEETIGEFLIDVTAPVVENISGNTDTWTTSKTLTSTLTDSSSGIKYYAFIKDNATKPAESSADWKRVTIGSSYNFSQTIMESGTYYLWAKDSVGNISGAKSIVVSKIDTDNPSAPTTMNFVFSDWSEYADNTWTNQGVAAARSLSGNGPTGSTDATSGIAKYQISKDNINWEDYNYKSSGIDSMYAMHSEGIHTRYFRAVDYAGNVSVSIVRTAKIDKTAPTVPTTMNFVFGDWSVYTDNTLTNQTVSAARSLSGYEPAGATDAMSGVAKYQISKDNVNWEDYNYKSSASDSMYAMHTDGTHVRYFRAVDHAGNASASIVRTAKIDKTVLTDTTVPTPPTLMNFVHPDWTVYADNTWTNAIIWAGRLSTSPGPAGSTSTTSTIAKYQISKDMVNWEDYKYQYTDMYGTPDDGIHAKYFRAVDNNGKVSVPIVRTAKIDRTAPTPPTTMNFVYGNWNVYADNTWTNQDIGIVRSLSDYEPAGATDAMSGVAKYQISSDNVNWEDYHYTPSSVSDTMYSLHTDGVYKRYFRAVDYAGNASASIVRTAKIDKTGPIVGILSGNTTVATANKTLTATITDSGSGVKYYAFIKDNATKPTKNSFEWKSITTTNSYNFSQTIMENGTYYLWGKDELGNISSNPAKVEVTTITSSVE